MGSVIVDRDALDCLLETVLATNAMLGAFLVAPLPPRLERAVNMAGRALEWRGLEDGGE